jgi:hypothetical protein
MIKESTVQKFIDANLNVIGVSNKIPANGSWKRWQSEMQTPQDLKGDGLGIICGAISGHLEVLDIDLKYSLDKTLYSSLKQKINAVNSKLIDSLMIIRTPSGGYHWLYRCPDGIEGNQKLAQRKATESERERSDKLFVLLETRGEKGYIASFPSPGYEVVQKKYSEIPTITAEDREIILSSAREFNEIIEPVKIPTSSLKNSFKITKENTGQTSWDHYNEEGNIPDILNQAGWTKVSEDSDREYWKRPGQTTAKHSGNYIKSMNCFKSFSSSTELEPEKAYFPYALYTMLIHNGNYKESARELFKQGYGDRSQVKEESVVEYAESRNKQNEDLKKPEEVDIAKYLAHYESDFAYLTSVRDDNVAKGLSTGSKIIDNHFLFKRGSFNTCIGHTSVGKTYSVIFLTMLAALKHDWKIVIIGMENSSASLKRQILELYLQKPLNKTTADEFIDGNEWLDQHYSFIQARGGHIKTISDALTLCYAMYDKDPFDMLFLDPYSGFQTNRIGSETSHEANYRLCSDMLNFTTKTNVNLMLSVHTVTGSRREKTMDGHLKRPYMDSVEGGSVFSNRADGCYIFHRLINHEDLSERLTTQFFVEKDRLLDQGGSLTSIDSPIRLQLRDYRFYVDGHEDVIYNIKNEGKVKSPEENNLTMKLDVDIPF